VALVVVWVMTENGVGWWVGLLWGLPGCGRITWCRGGVSSLAEDWGRLPVQQMPVLSVIFVCLPWDVCRGFSCWAWVPIASVSTGSCFCRGRPVLLAVAGTQLVLIRCLLSDLRFCWELLAFLFSSLRSLLFHCRCCSEVLSTLEYDDYLVGVP
jgi:hypothetical protein